MLDVLNFFAESVWRVFGLMIVIGVTLEGIRDIVKAYRNKE